MANYESQPGKRVHQADAIQAVVTDMREKLAQERLGDTQADARCSALLLDLIAKKPAAKNVIFESGRTDD